MAAEQHNTTQLTPILEDLQARIAGLEELVILRRDHTLIASVPFTEDDIRMTPMMTDFSDLMDELCDTLEHGIATEAMVKGSGRFLAMYKLHETDVLLGILGDSAVNFGLLNSGCRAAIEKIHHILEQNG